MDNNAKHSTSSDNHESKICSHNRRDFLKGVCAGAAAAVGAQAGLNDVYANKTDKRDDQVPAVSPQDMPTIKIGKYTISRLVSGCNPIQGYAHSTRNLSNHMLEYFTLERTVEYIQRCERHGINTWQGAPGDKVAKALQILRENGSKIHWMCLASDHTTCPSIKELLTYKPIALVHHGSFTDALFRSGKSQKVHDYVKRVKDTGIMCGVSAHNPANIAHIAEKDWENDFFMTCCYYVTRPAEEIRSKLGTEPLGEPFLKTDREDMLNVVRKVKKPCLAFKILAAGRHCWGPPGVESAFKFAFKNIKPIDGVIVGMYPRFKDEIAENVQMTVKYGKLA